MASAVAGLDRDQPVFRPTKTSSNESRTARRAELEERIVAFMNYSFCGPEQGSPAEHADALREPSALPELEPVEQAHHTVLRDRVKRLSRTTGP